MDSVPMEFPKMFDKVRKAMAPEVKKYGLFADIYNEEDKCCYTYTGPDGVSSLSELLNIIKAKESRDPMFYAHVDCIIDGDKIVIYRKPVEYHSLS